MDIPRSRLIQVSSCNTYMEQLQMLHELATEFGDQSVQYAAEHEIRRKKGLAPRGVKKYGRQIESILERANELKENAERGGPSPTEAQIRFALTLIERDFGTATTFGVQDETKDSLRANFTKSSISTLIDQLKNA